MKQAFTLVSFVLFCGYSTAAPNKNAGSAPVTDNIEVIAHIPITGGPVAQMSTGVDWRRHYLYVEHGPQGEIMIVDVSDPKQPKTAGVYIPASQNGSAHLYTIVGTSALLTNSIHPSSHAASTITLMSFANPAQPKIVRQFTGVTSILKDPGRALIYIANVDGVWILREQAAEDPELQKRYGEYIRYNH